MSVRPRERVLVVEDDRDLAALLVEEIGDYGCDARSAGDVEAALEQVSRWRPDLVVTDLRLPGPSGLDLLRALRARPAPPNVVVVTAFGTVRQAVEALQEGAHDFLTKPIDFDHLRISVTRALEERRLRRQLDRLREVEEAPSYHGMLGRSPAMRATFDQLSVIARAAGPVLLMGESGTGKDLAARALHEESDRRDGPYVPVNSAGLPEALLESEFFGHAAGAFSGARGRREGLLVQADGGTLFLDEIGEMPLALQAKLLRVLQNGRFRAVGADREQEVDVRVVAATNRDLEEEVAAGRFREDLYFRLETFTVRLPPLRDRGDDLAYLADSLVRGMSARAGKEITGLSPAAMRLLEAYPFPGNVRELRNAIERAVTFCDGPFVEPGHLPRRLREAAGRQAEQGVGLLAELTQGEVLPTLPELERRYVQYVLDRVDGNKRRAAALLGIGRRTLYRKLTGDAA